MANPRAYLETTLTRWVDRGTLMRQDANIQAEGVEVKIRYLQELRKRVRQHRREDLDQLSDDRRDARARWDERLRRLEAWIVAGAELGQTSGKLKGWHDSSDWFTHAQKIGQRYKIALEKKISRLEQQLADLKVKVPQWSDRLLLKESDLRGFLEREAAKGMEVLISSARKQPLLDFVYAEREEEGRLAREFTKVRTAANRALERFGRAEKWADQKVLMNPGYFEIQKNSVVETWSEPQKRYHQLREETLNLALSFEESRRRLRWIYETIQKIRVVKGAPAAPQRRPLLERLFKPDDN